MAGTETTSAGHARRDYEWPSPLRSTGSVEDTGAIFHETLAALATPAPALRAVPAALGDVPTQGAQAAAPTPARRLFPADRWQMRACVQACAGRDEAAVVYTSRAPVPDLTDVNDELMFATGYAFSAGTDDLIREGSDGYLVGYGDTLHLCLDVIERLLADGISIGLVGKPTLDAPDQAMLARLARAPAVLLIETLADPLGIGPRLEAWLDELGFGGAYARLALPADRDGLPQAPTAGHILGALRRLLPARSGAHTARALTREELRDRAVRCIAVDDSAAGLEEVDLPAPKVIGTLDHRLAAKLGPYRFQTPFAAELRDVRLLGPHAVGFTADGRPILETAANRIDVLGRSLDRTPPERFDAPAAAHLDLALSLVDLWSPLYAHWLMEGLTRLQAWEAYAEATGERPALIIDADPPAWMRESLRLMGVDADACVQWRGGPVQVERLVIGTRRRERGRVSARALAWVRERLLPNLDPAPSPGPRRIFITRADSRFRQVRNEDELLTALAPLGFERVRLSDLPWAEQVRLFRDVEAVVAAHGAGMTNLMFSTRRPLVVELFGQKVSHMNYTLGLGTGCDHRVLCCKPDGDDLWVDTERLLRLIEM
jgi:hypothetical protein